MDCWKPRTHTSNQPPPLPLPSQRYIPAGSLSSRQSSLEVEEPPVRETSQREDLSSYAESSTGPAGNIIVFDYFTPRDETVQGKGTEAVKEFRFPEESLESMTSIQKLMIQIDEKCEEQDSFQLSSQSRMLTSELCSMDQYADLKKEVEALKASCVRYELQNEELRREIHLSTSDIVALDKSKREALSELQRMRAQVAVAREEAQLLENALQKVADALRSQSRTTAETLSAWCDIVCRDVETLVEKCSKLKTANEDSAAENRRLSDLVSDSDQTVSSLRQLVLQKERHIAQLEDQIHQRAAASRSACESASSSFHRSSHLPKAKRKESPLETLRFSAYLLEDATDEGERGSRTYRETSRPESRSTCRSQVLALAGVSRRELEQRMSARTQCKVPKFIWKGRTSDRSPCTSHSSSTHRTQAVGGSRKFEGLE